MNLSTHLDLSDREVASLAGVLLAAGLTHLDLSQNALTTLTDLPALPQLEELLLSRNRLASLEGITRAPGLRRLSLSYTPPLTDLRPLAGLARLEVVYLRGVQPESLSPLSALHQLEAITLSALEPALLAQLSDLPALAALHLTGRLESLEELPPLPRLRVLGVTHAPHLSSLDGLERFPAVSELSLAFTSLRVLSESDLSRLAALPLTRLDLRATAAASAFPRHRFTHLSELRLA